MTLENLYKIAKSVNDLAGKDVRSEMVFFLNKDEHETLQQDVYKYKTSSMINYKSEKTFNIIIYNTQFQFKVN